MTCYAAAVCELAGCRAKPIGVCDDKETEHALQVEEAVATLGSAQEAGSTQPPATPQGGAPRSRHNDLSSFSM